MARPISDGQGGVPEWPKERSEPDPFEQLDLETWFGSGTAMISAAALPQGWTEARLEALWRTRGADLEPGPDWYAWERWGEPGGSH